jgi:hypothetical protein
MDHSGQHAKELAFDEQVRIPKMVHTVWRERFIPVVALTQRSEVIDAIVLLPHLESLCFNPPRPAAEGATLIQKHQIGEVPLPPGELNRILVQHDFERCRSALDSHRRRCTIYNHKTLKG